MNRGRSSGLYEINSREFKTTIFETEVTAPYSAILLGATGNVGSRIVQLLIESPLCAKVTVVTRRKTGAFAHAKVAEVVVNMDRLAEELAPHVQGVDIALAAFGVGKGTAKLSDEELRKVEVEYPRAFCLAAKAGGARVGAVMTAAGADAGSRVRYARFIGEKEEAVRAVGFEFLALFRPSVILGNSNTPGLMELAMRPVGWVLPSSRMRAIHKDELARAMVGQAEEAWAALRSGEEPGGAPVKVLEYKEMRRFFVGGESGRG
jgi:uncharacterized protein YbjT (DUF2867 family)